MASTKYEGRRIYGTKIHNLVTTSDEWPALPSPTSSSPCLALKKLDGRAPRWDFYVKVHGLTQGRCRLAMCRGGGGGRFRAPVREFFMSSSVVGRSCSMEDLLYYDYGLWWGMGYWSPIAFCSDGVLCHLTRIVLYSAIPTAPYLPTTKRDHHHRLSRVRSLSVSLSPAARGNRGRGVLRGRTVDAYVTV